MVSRSSARTQSRRGGVLNDRLAYIAPNAYTVGMAILNIRKLPDHVHARLRLRAAHNGRSMEAEARDILERACAHHYTAAEGSSTVADGPNSPDSPDSKETSETSPSHAPLRDRAQA